MQRSHTCHAQNKTFFRRFFLLGMLCIGWSLLLLTAHTSHAYAATKAGQHSEQKLAGSTSPTPVIVDTDMFGDVDDVGALAVLNAFTSKGEANLVGVVVDTQSSYTAQCVSAIDTYFGHPDIPIGITYPVTNDVPTSTPNYLTSCAQNFPQKLQYAQSIPTALSVYRKTLAAQPDGSVVIVAIGFEGRLSELLHSSADAYSPLDGYDLINQKVKELVVMGGGYPSMQGDEFNFAGDPGAAADVAANWPTKIVYDGFEIGVNVNAGHTLVTTTPPTDPVRAAYSIYVGAGNDRSSWDLTAAYYAVRQDDGLFQEVGNGSNQIDPTTGGNSWVSTPVKNQVYLTMPDAGNVEQALEPLLTYVPDAAQGSFVEGVNLDGPAVTIAGNPWFSQSQALANGLTITNANEANNTVSPLPATDSATTTMLQSELWRTGTINLTQTLPNGSYNIYFWVMEDYQDYYHQFTVAFQGTPTTSVFTGVVGTWSRYGPFTINVDNGVMSMDLVPISGDALIQGLAIFHASLGQFVTGVDLDGPAVTIAGNPWLSQSQALANGLTITNANEANNTVTPVPAVDGNTMTMLQSELWRTGNINLSQTLPDGNYAFTFWVMEDYQNNYHHFTVDLQSSPVITLTTGTVGTWTRYGPFPVSVSNGVLSIDLVRISGDTLIQGFEITD